MSAASYRADGAEQIIETGILEDEARHTGVDKLDDVLVDRQQVHNNYSCSRRLFSQSLGYAQAIVVPQPDVEQNYLRLRVSQQRGVTTRTRGDHSAIAGLIEHGRHSFANEPIVLDEYD